MFFSKNKSKAQQGGHPEAYSDSGFWKVVTKLTKRSSGKVLSAALALYYCLRDPDTPGWAKSVIIGALGYLIFPLDFIPDAILGIGFVDDWGVIAAAMTSVIAHIKEEHKERAAAKADRLFGNPNQNNSEGVPEDTNDVES